MGSPINTQTTLVNDMDQATTIWSCSKFAVLPHYKLFCAKRNNNNRFLQTDISSINGAQSDHIQLEAYLLAQFQMYMKTLTACTVDSKARPYLQLMELLLLCKQCIADLLKKKLAIS